MIYMEIIKETSVNSLKVSEDVIASVVKLAVNSVDGVAGLCLGKKDKLRKAIAMKLDSDFPEITVKINVLPDCNAVSVCENVQKKVREDMMSMTGIALNRVNVKVERISSAG